MGLIKRIVYFIPTLIIISLITFGLSKITPGDPVKLALGNTDKGGEAGQAQHPGKHRPRRLAHKPYGPRACG